MNIFVLDFCPKKAAEYHCDKHVVKMVVETAQMLSTVLTEHELPAPYKSTHKNHPCTKWVNESGGNYEWTKLLFRYLSEQYTLRYNKNHLSYEKLIPYINVTPEKLQNSIDIITPFALAMPDDCKLDCPIDSYRLYYKTHKRHLFSWKNKIPEWI